MTKAQKLKRKVCYTSFKIKDYCPRYISLENYSKKKKRIIFQRLYAHIKGFFLSSYKGRISLKLYFFCPPQWLSDPIISFHMIKYSFVKYVL